MATESATRKRERVILLIEDKTGVIDMLALQRRLPPSAVLRRASFPISRRTRRRYSRSNARCRRGHEFDRRKQCDLVIIITIYNYIIILGENINFAMLQLSELFTYPNTPLPKGGRISEDALY